MAKKVKASKPKKPIYKRWWFLVLIVFIVIGVFMPKDSETHLYDNAQVKDVMNSSRTEKIGEYSIIEVDSSEVTEEALNDWYFNYVEKNDFNFCLIVYKDKENMGVHAINGMVDKDVHLIKDDYGDYSVGAGTDDIVYVPTDDKKLKEAKFADDK